MDSAQRRKAAGRDEGESLSGRDFQHRLERRFRRQQEFAAPGSPLYARLCELVAGWLTPDHGEDPLAAWLTQAGAARASFDLPMLLLAGVHRDILAGCPEVAGLARYFPTVGGDLLLEQGDIGACLREAIMARRDVLGHFLRTATVQTNETARGLCWLLPVLYTGWPAIHLVDLGASAGLNLAADQRRYRLLDRANGHTVFDFGQALPEQFTVVSSGSFAPPLTIDPPTLLSRIGCDLAPFPLRTREDEQTLAAFVWGDQVQRLARLREGIAALQQVNRSSAPVTLIPADLPDHLPRLLKENVGSRTDAPVLLFNTYLTAYLHDKGASLAPHLADWAANYTQPVLWLQWEPLRQGPEPPEFGWLGWTAEFWQQGRHERWHLAWVHPHGARVQWLEGMAGWAEFWRKQRPK